MKKGRDSKNMWLTHPSRSSRIDAFVFAVRSTFAYTTPWNPRVHITPAKKFKYQHSLGNSMETWIQN